MGGDSQIKLMVNGTQRDAWEAQRDVKRIHTISQQLPTKKETQTSFPSSTNWPVKFFLEVQFLSNGSFRHLILWFLCRVVIVNS